MSKANVEVVKRVIDAFNGRDVDGILRCVNPDLEWFPAIRVTFGGDIYYCMWLRHGRCFREEHHLTIKGALHALGLEEQTLESAGLKAARPEE